MALADAEDHGDGLAVQEGLVFDGVHGAEVEVGEDHLRFSSSLVGPFEWGVFFDEVVVVDAIEEVVVSERVQGDVGECVCVQGRWWDDNARRCWDSVGVVARSVGVLEVLDTVERGDVFHGACSCRNVYCKEKHLGHLSRETKL